MQALPLLMEKYLHVTILYVHTLAFGINISVPSGPQVFMKVLITQLSPLMDLEFVRLFLTLLSLPPK